MCQCMMGGGVSSSAQCRRKRQQGSQRLTRKRPDTACSRRPWPAGTLISPPAIVSSSSQRLFLYGYDYGLTYAIDLSSCRSDDDTHTAPLSIDRGALHSPSRHPNCRPRWILPGLFLFHSILYPCKTIVFSRPASLAIFRA